MLAVALLSGFARGVDNPVYVPAGCAKLALEYKPRAMCVGNGGMFRRLSWLSYGGRSAVARGQTFHNNCVPNCAEGSGSWVGTKIRVFRVR